MKDFDGLMKMDKRDLEREMARANEYSEVVKGVYSIKMFFKRFEWKKKLFKIMDVEHLFLVLF